MTVETTTDRASYATNGTTGPFTIPFYFLANDHLQAIYATSAGVETDLVLTVDYNVTGAGDETGGSLTLVSAIAAGGTLTILRDVPATQLTDYLAQDAFPAESHEAALDKLTMLAQQSLQAVERTLRFPSAETITSAQATLAIKASRLDKLLTFDATTGLPIMSNFTHTQVESAIAAAYLAGSTADAVASIAETDGAIATTSQEVHRREVSIFDNLTDGQKSAVRSFAYSTDLTAALQEIIDWMVSTGRKGKITMPGGGYLLGGVNVPDSAGIAIEGDYYGTMLKKAANGPMITLGKLNTLAKLAIDGNGVSYTGQGILVNTGALDNVSWRKLFQVDVFNTASYCLEFTGNRAGYASHITSCKLVPKDLATYAIKAAGNGGVVEDNGNRMFRDVWTFGNRIADLTDANDCDFVGCHGFWPKFTATTHKTNFTGGRLNLYDANDQFTGTSNVVDGITMNYSGGAVLTILAGATNCRFAPSIAAGSGISIVDQSGSTSSGNEIWLPRASYTPTWGGTGGTPAIGNGAIGGVCTRRGTTALVNVLLNIGTTTAFNTSTGWTFTVPYTASRTSTGPAYILDSGTSHYIGTAKIDAGSNVVSVFRDGAGIGVGYLTPMTWATNDILRFDLEFDIQ